MILFWEKQTNKNGKKCCRLMKIKRDINLNNGKAICRGHSNNT